MHPLSINSLADLHEAIVPGNWKSVTPFDKEWMESQYGLIILNNPIRGLDLLANKKSKTKIASLGFDLAKIDSKGWSVLEEILDSLSSDFFPISDEHHAVRKLLDLGFECVESQRTKAIIGIKRIAEIALEVTLNTPLSGSPIGLVEIHSTELILNGAPKRKVSELKEYLCNIDWYLSEDMDYLEYVKLDPK